MHKKSKRRPPGTEATKTFNPQGFGFPLMNYLACASPKKRTICSSIAILDDFCVIETVKGQEIFCSKTESTIESSRTIDTSSFVSSSDEESYCKSRGAN
ncbi:hypothetical protein NPIL_57301 [Nephila pilipes]|uniref:Uncharacterized protein n=1 Tax=Nephila pilipes TaxID=299642 RepID=A0A8X6PIC4_NEPPI|nr:hypothetical protein NPIL_57301 [Nephila pilipes]